MVAKLLVSTLYIHLLDTFRNVVSVIALTYHSAAVVSLNCYA
jgi:hypothetical protein